MYFICLTLIGIVVWSKYDFKNKFCHPNSRTYFSKVNTFDIFPYSAIWESAKWTRQYGIRQFGNRQTGTNSTQLLVTWFPVTIFTLGSVKSIKTKSCQTGSRCLAAIKIHLRMYTSEVSVSLKSRLWIISMKWVIS